MCSTKVTACVCVSEISAHGLNMRLRLFQEPLFNEKPELFCVQISKTALFSDAS